jgi:hypothetical protein
VTDKPEFRKLSRDKIIDAAIELRTAAIAYTAAIDRSSAKDKEAAGRALEDAAQAYSKAVHGETLQ